MNNFKKWLCLSLSALLLSSAVAVFAGCAKTDDAPANDTGGTTVAEDNTAEVDNRFQGVNYDGREFRVYTSTNIASAGMGNSNFLIEGTGETAGGLVNDAVVARNVMVEELLGVELVFTQIDLDYTQVSGNLTKFTSSGTDDFDLVINDIWAFAEMTIGNHFRNVLNEDCVFDFDRPYWYKDYMEDLRFMEDYQTVLAGDYFIDVLRSAHLLLLNKQMYTDYTNRPADELYDTVSNFEWTYDKMYEVISNKYDDKNRNNVRDAGDQYGLLEMNNWGGHIPFMVSGTTYFDRDETGAPMLVVQEGDRANVLVSKISALYNNDSTSETSDQSLLPAFVNEECLMVGYQRLGSLENTILRQMEGDIAVLPYPMLFESDQKYITSTHDTTEMGTILTTVKDLEFVSTVIEVLNRETASILMPKYYRECLQVQCVDDEKASAMIDIIHDNFDNAFVLAYNQTLNACILDSVYDAVEQGREFSAVFAGRSKSVTKALTNMIVRFEKHNTKDR